MSVHSSNTLQMYALTRSVTAVDWPPKPFSALCTYLVVNCRIAVADSFTHHSSSENWVLLHHILLVACYVLHNYFIVILF